MGWRATLANSSAASGRPRAGRAGQLRGPRAADAEAAAVAVALWSSFLHVMLGMYVCMDWCWSFDLSFPEEGQECGMFPNNLSYAGRLSVCVYTVCMDGRRLLVAEVELVYHASRRGLKCLFLSFSFHRAAEAVDVACDEIGGECSCLLLLGSCLACPIFD